MWRILAACLLVTSLVEAHHDGTDHHHHEDEHKHKHEGEHKALILLEIEPNVNSTPSKDKRSPQHGSSQAVFGASPGQFIVRTTSGNEPQPEVPPEYLSLLQQLVSQQQQDGGAEGQPPSQPVIQQLLVARNPDPSAVQFTSTPGQAPPRRPPPSPQAQLQQLYFNSQFQQQIPVRPRILRPRPRPASPSPDDFSALTTSSQVHSVHEARLRASLAGSDPNLAVQALTQQQAFPTTASPDTSALYEQQLTQLATAAQEQLIQLQAVPQQQQQQAQQQTAYSISPQVRYVQQPQQQPTQRAVSYSRQAAPSQQLISERSKPSRRPSPAPEQYLRETTQPLPQQTLVQAPQRQQTSDPSIYLSSESGRQSPTTSQDDYIISQLLGQQDRGLFPGASPTAASVAEEVIKSTTALPPTASRSSIYVTQTSNVKNAQNQNKITIDEVGAPQVESGTPLPVVHLPTPDGQRPLTQSEFKALIDAGFNISPVPADSPQESAIIQTVAPEYYRPTTKKQRSYVTPAPPPRNQVYQSRQKQLQQKEQNQAVESPEVQAAQQRGQVSRFQIQQTKPQQVEEELVQYVRRPVPAEAQTIRQPTQVTRLEYVTQKPESEPEEETIQFIRLPTTPEVQDARQRAQFTGYNTDAGRAQQPTQFHRFQEERQSLPQVQSTRYQPQTTENEEQKYQTETLTLQQTPAYRDEEESVAQNIQRFHQPIIVAELPTTTPVPSPTPRRRRPRPSHSRIVYRAHTTPDDQEQKQEPPTQFLISYDSVPEATNYGTRNSRVRGRRPSPSDES
ncbi:uncharacterized protein [Periplaneta americana]|uniref:uncharacterized protein n=1 Tax=Periplaneta americana TaxID=6978 RepID=UPI0037E72B9D